MPGLGPLVVVALALAALYYEPWEPVGRLTYYRIRLGMSQEEVEAVMGEPPGNPADHRPPFGTTGPGGWLVEVAESGLPSKELPDVAVGRSGKARDGQTVTLQQWWGDSYRIWVAFGEDGKAVGVYLLKAGG
jgi:hypothetical protein